MTQPVSTCHRFCFMVDGKEFDHENPRITGGEIMDAAEIPHEVGLILVRPDGTQEVIEIDEVVNLAQLNAKFKRCPDFIRG